MARSSNEDPIEKFRFKVTVVAIDTSITGAVETFSGLTGDNLARARQFSILFRAGFSAITMPKANVSEIAYRENIDNQSSIKVPGLVKYDPITLSRGVTSNRDLYDWYRLVNEEIALLNVANELTKEAKFAPVQSDNFRKDIIIEVLDRTGKPVKAWYLFNAWPTVYQPGNDLLANSDEKLIENLTLTYEKFIELEGGPEGFIKEIEKGLGVLAVNSALNIFGI